MLTERRFSPTGMRMGHVLYSVQNQWFIDEHMHNLNELNGYETLQRHKHLSGYLGGNDFTELIYDSSSSHHSFVGGLNDPVLSLLVTETTIPGHPIEWSDWHINAAKDPVGFSMKQFTKKPRRSALSLAEDVSVKSISQTVDIVKRLLTDWDFTPYQGGTPAFKQLLQKEKPCRHLTYDGDVTVGEMTFFPHLGDELATWDGPAYHMFEWQETERGLVPYVLEWSSMPWNWKGARKHPRVQLAWLERSKRHHHTQGEPYLVTGSTSHWLEDLTYTFHEDGAMEMIKWSTCSIYNPWNQPRQHKFTFRCVGAFSEIDDRLNFMTGVPLDAESHHEGVFLVETIATEHRRDLVAPGEWGPWYKSEDFIHHGFERTLVPLLTNTCFWSLPSDAEGVLGFEPVTLRSNVTGVRSNWTPDYMLVDHEIRLTEFIGQTRGLLAVAAADAVNKMQVVLSSNNIENLMQLSSMLDFIEPIKALFALKKKVQNGQLNEAGLQFIDILASTKLLMSYGLAPTINDAKEIAKLAKPLREQFKSPEFGEMKTVYGTATYEGHNVNGIDSVHVEAHVKLCASMSDSTLAGWLMPLEALGLLPNLHRIDDNIAYTFLAGWFTNQNAKMQTVDAQLYAPLVMDLHGSVISLKYTTPINQELLSQYGLSDQTWTESPMLTLYLRDLQAGIPSLFRTDLDLQPPQPIESKFGLSTALLWTTIRDAGRAKRPRRKDRLY